MSIEEIIAKLEEMAEDREEKILPGCLGYDEIEPLREAAALLKSHQESQPNEPLTLEELLEMDGKPTWCKEEKRWGIVFVTQCGSCGLVPFFWALNHDGDFMFDIEKRQLTLFRRPPKED